MKYPKPRGAAINNTRYRIWSETFASYRHAINVNSIDRWLDQFDSTDKDLAARILDCVEFISLEQIGIAFRQILAELRGWHIEENQRVGKWRFVPLSGSPGESGDSMIHRFRLANRLNFRKYNELFVYRSQLMSERLTEEDSIVFIDDFSGTGKQVCDFWTEFQELLPEQPTTYLVLAGVNNQAKQKIDEETDFQVVSQYEFNNSDNIFSDSCRHFTQDEKDKILRYCRRADRTNPRGFGECGLVLIFAHNTPNNSIPILHANRASWEGLFRRND